MVPRRMQLNARFNLLLWYTRQRQKRCYGRHGRETETRSYLHGGAYRNIRLGPIGCWHRCSSTRGEPKPHVEGYAIPGGTHLEIRTTRKGTRLDLEWSEEKGLPQIRLRAHGRRGYGEPGRAVDQRAASTYLQVRWDQRGKAYRSNLWVYAQCVYGCNWMRWLFERGSVPRTRTVQGKKLDRNDTIRYFDAYRLLMVIIVIHALVQY